MLTNVNILAELVGVAVEPAHSQSKYFDFIVKKFIRLNSGLNCTDWSTKITSSSVILFLCLCRSWIFHGKPKKHADRNQGQIYKCESQQNLNLNLFTPSRSIFLTLCDCGVKEKNHVSSNMTHVRKEPLCRRLDIKSFLWLLNEGLNRNLHKSCKGFQRYLFLNVTDKWCQKKIISRFS